MNLIKKLFGKREKTFHEIRLEDVPAWLSASHEKVSRDIINDVSSTFLAINKARQRISNSVVLLENAKPEGRFHLKMVKVASSNRDNMVKQVKMLLENIIVPDESDVSAIMAFRQNAIQTLGLCLENMMKSYQYTKLVFMEESKTVISDVNSLGRLINELAESLNSKKEQLDSFDKTHELVGIIMNKSNEIDLLEKSIKENEEKCISLKQEILNKQSALSLLQEGEPWNQYMASMEGLSLLEASAEKMLSEIQNKISPLHKALNRLKQLSDSGRYTLAPEDREALNLCLSRPVDVPPEFFIKFQNIVESGVLNLPKTEKFISQIKLCAASLGKIQDEYYVVSGNIQSKRDSLSQLKIITEEKDLTIMLSRLQDNLKETERYIDDSRSQLSSLKEDIVLRRDELQNNIQVIDRNIRVI